MNRVLLSMGLAVLVFRMAAVALAQPRYPALELTPENWRKSADANRLRYGVAGNAAERAGAAIRCGDAFRFGADLLEGDAARKTLDEAKTWYEIAVEDAKKANDLDQRQRAANNLAVVHLDPRCAERSPTRALTLFRDNFGTTAGSSECEYIYAYNYGRALDLAKPPDPAAARQKYIASFKLQPDYGPPAEKLTESLLNSPEPPYADAVAYVAFVMKQVDGRPGALERVQRARQVLHELLVMWGDDPGVGVLLPYWLLGFERMQLSPSAFLTSELPRLAKLRKAARLQPLIAELEAIYRPGTFRADAPIVTTRTVTNTFPTWWSVLDAERGADGPAIMARLLHHVGEDMHCSTSRQPQIVVDDKGTRRPMTPREATESALARFTAAYAFDHRHIDAGLSALGLFSSRFGIAGKKDAHDEALFKSLVDSLYDEKADLRLKATTTSEWENLYSLHLVLAEAFRERSWGPPPRSRNVIDQVEDALADAKKIPGFEADARLYALRGEAYLKLSKYELAWRDYLKASEVYLRASHFAEARQAFAEMEKIEARVSGLPRAEDRNRHAALVRQLKGERFTRLSSFSLAAPVDTITFGREGKNLLIGADRHLYTILAAPNSTPRDIGLHWPVEPGRFVVNDDGKSITGFSNNKLWKWNVNEPNNPTAIAPFTMGFTAVFASGKNEKLIARGRNGGIFCAEWNDGRPEWVRVSNDGGHLLATDTVRQRVVLAEGPRVQLQSLAKDEVRIIQLQGHEKDVTAAAFSASGGLVATVSDDRKVRVWSTATGKLRRTIAMPETKLYSVAFAPNRPLLAIGGGNGLVRIWNLRDEAEPPVSLRADGDQVRYLVFAPDGASLAAGCSEAFGFARGSGTIWTVK